MIDLVINDSDTNIEIGTAFPEVLNVKIGTRNPDTDFTLIFNNEQNIGAGSEMFNFSGKDNHEYSSKTIKVESIKYRF